MKVSIIIPTLNVARYIESCLFSVMHLDYPEERREVILVDNGSRDSTVEKAKKYNIKIFVKPNCTISVLRNFGAKNAEGEILAFLDADCIVPQDWLKKAVALLKRERNIGAVGCWYALPSDASFIERIWDIHMGKRRNRIGEIDWIPSGNFVVVKNLFEKIGGFNESLSTMEDIEICERIRKEGYVIFSHPELSVVHLRNPKTVREFFKREFWHGKGVLQNLLNDLPKLRFNKAIVFSAVTLFFLFLIITGLGIWLFKKDGRLFFFSFAGILFVPLILGIKAIRYTPKKYYFFHLVFLFLLFGISRAFSLLDFEVWRTLLSKVLKLRGV